MGCARRGAVPRRVRGCGDVEEPEEAMVDTMVEHYSKLFAASEDALRHLEVITRMKENIRQSLESLVENHRALVPSLKIRLSQLQSKCHRKQWQWWQLEFSDACQKDSSLDTQPQPDSSNSQLLGCVRLAIDKMVQQCSSAADSVLGSMDLFSKLDVIEEFMLDKMETMRFLSLPLEPRVCWTADSPKAKELRRHPRHFKKYAKHLDVTPRTPFPSAETSECSRPQSAPAHSEGQSSWPLDISF